MRGIERMEGRDLTVLALLELGPAGEVEGPAGARGNPAVT